MSDEYLPLLRAAKHLGVSRPTLTKLARSGAIPVYGTVLNERVKLFAVADLERLRSPRPKTQPAGPKEAAIA